MFAISCGIIYRNVTSFGVDSDNTVLVTPSYIQTIRVYLRISACYGFIGDWSHWPCFNLQSSVEADRHIYISSDNIFKFFNANESLFEKFYQFSSHYNSVLGKTETLIFIVITTHKSHVSNMIYFSLKNPLNVKTFWSVLTLDT